MVSVATITDAPAWFLSTIARGDDHGYIELRTRNHSGKVEQHFLAANTDPAEVRRRIEELAEDHDVWVGMAVRSRREGTNEAAYRVNLLWADLDRGRADLDRFPVPPSLIIASGTEGHFQAFWALKEHADLT